MKSFFFPRGISSLMADPEILYVIVFFLHIFFYDSYISNILNTSLSLAALISAVLQPFCVFQLLQRLGLQLCSSSSLLSESNWHFNCLSQHFHLIIDS